MLTIGFMIGLSAEDFWRMSLGEFGCAINAHERKGKNDYEYDMMIQHNELSVLRYVASLIYNSNVKRANRKDPQQLIKLPFEKMYKKTKRKPLPEKDYLKILSKQTR